MAKTTTQKAAPKSAAKKAAPAKPKVDYRKEYSRAFDAGRRAKRSNIPENQMPVLSDGERKAYLEGYKA